MVLPYIQLLTVKIVHTTSDSQSFVLTVVILGWEPFEVACSAELLATSPYAHIWQPGHRGS
jgi:hypothetical protein